MTPIHLDHNATTPNDPAVLTAMMMPFLREEFGKRSCMSRCLIMRCPI
jgi:cysteine sulfinate desulfinase/cysteine desulfurase-like protein